MDAVFILLSPSFLVHFVATEKEFFYVHEYKSWEAAQTYCRETYTDLVTVYNAAENLELVSLAQYECIWLGVHYKENAWRWSMDNTLLSDSLNVGFWGTGQPNNMNGDEHCGLVSTHYVGVDDRRCGESQFFICSDAENQHTLVQQQLTWEKARAYCRTNFKDLATIRTDQLSGIQAEITALGKVDVWIGLYRDSWNVWSDNGFTNFSKWATGHPSYTNNNHCGCLAISSGKWEGSHCTAIRYFFCYGDGADSSTAVSTSTPVTVKSGTTTTASSLTAVGTSTTVMAPTVPLQVGNQTVLNVKVQSENDLNNKETQLQILEKIKERLASLGVKDIIVKWRVIKKMAPDAVLDVNCPKNVYSGTSMIYFRY